MELQLHLSWEKCHFQNPYISLHFSGYRETLENTSQAKHKDQNSDGKCKSEPSIFYQFCELAESTALRVTLVLIGEVC